MLGLNVLWRLAYFILDGDPGGLLLCVSECKEEGRLPSVCNRTWALAYSVWRSYVADCVQRNIAALAASLGRA